MDQKKPNRGAMGFSKACAGEFEASLRQRASGRWTAAKRASATVDQRAQAIEMHCIGRTERQIAASLGVSPATAHRWIKAASQKAP